MSPTTKSLAKKPATKLAAKAPSKPTAKDKDKGKDKEKKCKKFAVSVLINTEDEKQQITFGLTHGCNSDNTDFWTIDFTLKVKKGNELKTRVVVHVEIGTNEAGEKAKADALAAEMKKTKKLDDERTDLLQTDVTDRALEIPPKDAQKDPELRKLLRGVL
jgi:hypothetical protein